MKKIVEYTKEICENKTYRQMKDFNKLYFRLNRMLFHNLIAKNIFLKIERTSRRNFSQNSKIIDIFQLNFDRL